MKIKLLTKKKGQSAFPVTFGFIVFNLIIFLLVSAFALDGETVGQVNNPINDDLINDTVDSSLLKPADLSFITSFRLVIFNLPWWLNFIVLSINGALITLIILAWLRGV